MVLSQADGKLYHTGACEKGLCAAGAASRRAQPQVRISHAKGQAYCREVLTPLIEAEERSLLRLSEKERALMVELGEKQCAYFEDEIQKMTKEKEQA